MNSVMTGSIKNPFQGPKFGDNLKNSYVSINLKILYKIKKKQGNEKEEKQKTGCLPSGELHKKIEEQLFFSEPFHSVTQSQKFSLKKNNKRQVKN